MITIAYPEHSSGELINRDGPQDPTVHTKFQGNQSFGPGDEGFFLYDFTDTGMTAISVM